MKVAVVLGTSKQDGNTRLLVNALLEDANAQLFDLTDYNISFYDYQHKNKSDDFLGLIEKLLKFEHIVFSSPVYWYAMSAQLKVFFDRLSDLLTIEKDLGRQLKGIDCSVVSSGFDKELPACFVDPFQMTAKYLDMEFKGFAYLSVQCDADLDNTVITIQQAVKNIVK